MQAAAGSDVAFSRELGGEVGTRATCSSLAHWVTEITQHWVLPSQPGLQGGARGAQLCTKDELCFQIPGTVAGVFS